MTVAVVPAAGRGSRFAADRPESPIKVLAPVAGVPMIRRTVSALLEGGADRAVVVVSAQHEPAVVAALDGLAVAVVVNPDPDRGMFSSIQCGVAQLGEDDRCVLLPGDMPFVRPETIAALLSAAIRSGLTVSPSFEGRFGHPLVMSMALRDRILEAPADAILSQERSRDTTISVAVNDPGVHRDVDRPGDLIIGG
jgi:molybdenum cofactor cytidylyltransferase